MNQIINVHPVQPIEIMGCTPQELQQSKWPKISKSKKSINVIDLFCGCGGLSLGVFQACLLAKHSFRIKLAVDNNQKAIDVYKDNFSKFSDRVENLDIKNYIDIDSKSQKATVRESRALSEFNGTDLVVAGPPCQGHSDLNNSSRRSDPRNMLYLAPVRAATVLKPKVILIENVPTVKRSHENVVGLAKNQLHKLGYFTNELTINLTQFGVPQSRTRHLLLASLRPLDSLSFLINSLHSRQLACFDYIEDIVDEASVASTNAFSRTTKLSKDNFARIEYLFREAVYDLPNKFRPDCHKNKDHSYISMYGRLNPRKPSQTITSGFGSMGQGRFVHPTRPRMLTAHEAARLQGFPDYFRFQCCQVTALREMVGNAVPPTLAKVVVKLLIDLGHFR